MLLAILLGYCLAKYEEVTGVKYTMLLVIYKARKRQPYWMLNYRSLSLMRRSDGYYLTIISDHDRGRRDMKTWRVGSVCYFLGSYFANLARSGLPMEMIVNRHTIYTTDSHDKMSIVWKKRELCVYSFDGGCRKLSNLGEGEKLQLIFGISTHQSLYWWMIWLFGNSTIHFGQRQ